MNENDRPEKGDCIRMGEVKKPSAGSKNGSKQNAKKNAKQVQRKQIAAMAGAIVFCAVMITWTVMLVRERLSRYDTNEQTSIADFTEISGWDDEDPDATTTTRPVYAPWYEDETTTAPLSTTNGTTTSTTATNATAPPNITPQSPNFIPAGTAASARTTATSTESNAPAATETTTTAVQTQPPQTPNTAAPAGEQIAANQMLAIYLAARGSGSSAYYVDAYGNSHPAVIMTGTSGLRIMTSAAAITEQNLLGGTGESTEHTWQTGAPFRVFTYDSGNRYLYYTSEGNNFRIVGYFDLTTCTNVWARLHYYQIGVDWQAEYHISRYVRPEASFGTVSEISSGTGDAGEPYGTVAAFEQELARALQTSGIPAGDPTGFTELAANDPNDLDVLRARAGDYNNGFSPQAGYVYGAVNALTGTVTLRGGAGSDTGSLAAVPAGSFLSVDTAHISGGWVPVRVLMNGSWIDGYISSEYVLLWKD